VRLVLGCGAVHRCTGRTGARVVHKCTGARARVHLCTAPHPSTSRTRRTRPAPG